VCGYCNVNIKDVDKLIIYSIYIILGVFTILALPLFVGFALVIGGGIMLEKLEIENTFIHIAAYLILISIAFKFTIWWDGIMS